MHASVVTGVRVLPWLALALCLCACEKRLSIGALSASSELPDDAGQHGEDDDDAGASSTCKRAHPLYDVGDDGEQCRRGEDTRVFRNALCSCGEIQTRATLTVDAFDSQEGAYVPGQRGGSVGANGAMYPAETRIGGSLRVHGENGIPLGGPLTVSGQLSDQGQLDGPYEVSVGGDARIGGALHVADIDVDGTLTVSDTSDVAVTAGNPPFTRGPIDVEEPCDCDRPLDVAALIAAAREDNDDALIGLDPRDGLKALSAPIELTLPCGRYYTAEFYAKHPITITVTGPVELYVQGNLLSEPGGSVDIQFTKGGRIDLFVEGGITSGDALEIGEPSEPERALLYAGGGPSLYFAGDTKLGAALYAPRSELVNDGRFELYGAALVKKVAASGAMDLHYDRALARDACARQP